MLPAEINAHSEYSTIRKKLDDVQELIGKINEIAGGTPQDINTLEKALHYLNDIKKNGGFANSSITTEVEKVEPDPADLLGKLLGKEVLDKIMIPQKNLKDSINIFSDRLQEIMKSINVINAEGLNIGDMVNRIKTYIKRKK